MRLQSFLSKAGVTSRRSAEDLIKTGRVSVNGHKVFEKGLSVNPELDTISINEKKIELAVSHVYIVLNKPKDVISTSSDTHYRKTPFDFIEKKYGRLFIAGRLDKDTTGFILLTNDGEVANRIIHPRFEVPKLYEVELHRPITLQEKGRLEEGILLEGKMTLPVRIRFIAKSENGSVIHLEMREGRKHQIKNMFKYFAIKVVNLKRVGMANIPMGDIKEGKYRLLTKDEIERLHKFLKLNK